MIRYGFACKTIGVPGASQQSLTLARADQESLTRITAHNLAALRVMLGYCREQGIPLMRISSDVVPLATHPQVEFDWKTALSDDLACTREVLRASGVRVSMHPGQYTVLNSPDPGVVQRSAADLEYHAAFLDALDADASACIVLHVGGVYGDKRAAKKRLAANCAKLSPPALSRLALENDERCYAVDDVLDLCRELGLPAIFDTLHHSLNPAAGHGPLQWIDRCARTWERPGLRQKIHYSQQEPGGRPGAHSRTVAVGQFLDFHRSLADRDLDVMLEVKDKNLSAIKCRNLTRRDPARKDLTDEWARYKYLVLERSPDVYQKIRDLLKQDEPFAESFYRLIETAMDQPLTPGHALNAAQHVWGYFKDTADESQRKRIMRDLELLQTSLQPLPRLKRKFADLAASGNVEYLLRSLYLYCD